MKSVISSILAAAAALLMCGVIGNASAFSSPAASVSAFTPRTHTVSVPRTSSSLQMVFGNKKSAAQKAAEEERAAKFWQGDWVCKDCGYIYNRAECAGLYFEEQGAGFRCPQCSGPRRRYAKKVGDVVGTTLDGGDAPILIFSFGGVALTIAFGIWAVNNL
eukprot:CAMPEP_0197434420 /NCGR_PEP_ID=MMETSP1175-20131217/2157_1 /TAXON_ID=1003142 /ORGANISM="Triceratium dubium, Strain CCMP147" /LENGTH=160 /DNA_ID=CAMNT_0042963135 /DNA_START=97 /DNA_END=579 /DNA_ORIENTATION=+